MQRIFTDKHKTWFIKGKPENLDFQNLSKILLCERFFRMKIQAMCWKRIFGNYIFDNAQVSWVEQELSNSSIKIKPIMQLKNG